VVRSKSKSDFWRKTFYGYITDNRLFFHVPVSGDFVFEAQVNGQYAALYDQAGLMLRLDSENWMKCGCEFFGQQRYASVVLTRGFSDWSTMSDLSDTAAIWWRAIRQKRLHRNPLLNGKDWTAVRQGYFPPNVKVEAGILCVPEGPGFDATFDHLKLDIS
jgi:regulation of enolase protein 1 (concanavalin A-like superfamily)